MMEGGLHMMSSGMGRRAKGGSWMATKGRWGLQMMTKGRTVHIQLQRAKVGSQSMKEGLGDLEDESRG